ncbi:MAG: DUF2142 domain-containing protein [Clostridia bacterium]
MFIKFKEKFLENRNTNIILLLLISFSIVYFNYDLKFNIPMISSKWKILFLIFSIGISIISYIFMVFINKKDRKTHLIFLFMAILLGSMYLISIPLFRGTDDHGHFYRIVQLSEFNIFSDDNDTIPSDFANILTTERNTSSSIKDRLLSSVDYTQRSPQVNRAAANYSPVNYIPQTIAFWISRLFHVGPYFYAYMAKIFNFICFLIFATISVKIIPCKKEFLSVILLSPAILSLVTTLTSDSILIGSSVLFISYIIYIKYNNIEINNKVILKLILLGGIIALCKTGFAIITLATLLLINKKSSKKDIMKILSVIIIALVLTSGWYFVESIRSTSSISPDIMAKQNEQLEFVKSNPIEYLVMNCKLFINQGYYYISNLFAGKEMCYTTVNLPSLVVFMYLITAVIAFLYDDKNIKINNIQKAILIFMILGFAIFVSFVMYTQWTIMDYAPGGSVINGVQSRYFVPFLPLLIMLFSNKTTIKTDKTKILNYTMFLNLCCVMATLITMIGLRVKG